MNRRVLLIDTDPAFRDTLTQLLNRYRVVVMSEPDPDRALSIANADAPSLIVIGVEEPEKAGFRAFQKCKKGALAKVPIVLVTRSVAPDAFAKHRGLKLHADEYIDKRAMTDDELVAKVDNLIGLGDLQEDDMGIAVEDEIPMEIADGDVVLDETVGDDASNEFANEHDLRTVGPGDGIKADQMLSAETDAAFDALLGDDEPKPPRVATQPPAKAKLPELAHEEPSVVDAVPQEVPHPGRREPEPAHADAVPEPVPHPSRPDSAEFPPVTEHTDHPEPVVALAKDRAVSEFAAEEAVAEVHTKRAESQPAIPLDEEELESLDDELVEEAEPEAPKRAQSEPVITSATKPEATSARKSGSHPAIDLGLDQVATNAQNEQSGVYDRKALRKIGELERQISQLTTELERSRAAAETAAKGGGREAQFLNLRESMLAKDKELKQIKSDLAARDHDLADAKEKLRQAQHAKSALESKNHDLEARIFESGDTAKELEAQIKAGQAQLAALQRDLDAKGDALTDAEVARAELENGLETERALRASNASDAERTLKDEREQLMKRQQAELAAARDDAQKAHDAALAQLREQLEAEHGEAIGEAIEETRRANAREHETAVVDIERKHAREVVNLKADAAGTLTALRNDLGGELERVNAELAELKDTHAETIASAAEDKAATVEQLTQKHAQQIEALEDEHGEARERDAQSHGQALAQLKAQLDRAMSDHEIKIETARRDLEGALAEHERAKGELHEQHQEAVGVLQAAHDEELRKAHDERTQVVEAAKRAAETHKAALADSETFHEQEIEDLRQSSEREANEHRAQIAAARRAAEEEAARHQAALEASARAHESAVEELEAKHDRQLSIANGDFLKQKAVAEAEHNKTLAAQEAAADSARRDLEAEHARVVHELTQERDELKRGLSSTRDNLKRSEGELASAVQTIAERNAELRAHAQAIAERDQRIADLRKEIEALEAENSSYQDQVLRAYQKIKSDEAMVARARKAMAIALTVLDEEGNPPSS
jgi:CheY-like chemotaxis protein/chromosome segregation ATPase